MGFAEALIHFLFFGVMGAFGVASAYWIVCPWHLATERMVWSFGLAVAFVCAPVVVSTAN